MAFRASTLLIGPEGWPPPEVSVGVFMKASFASFACDSGLTVCSHAGRSTRWPSRERRGVVSGTGQVRALV